MGESSFHEWCAGAWADRRWSAGVKWLICVFASWSACFLPIWHRSCLEVGGEGVELCSEACSTGRLEEKHFACSGPCPLCCALSSGVGGWQCYSPGAEGPASSTAKRCSCVPPRPRPVRKALENPHFSWSLSERRTCSSRPRGRGCSG